MKNKTIIIGVSGRKQSGKSSLCDYLSFPSSKVYSFADPLKELCIEVLGLTRKQCYGSDKDKNSLTKYSWPETPQFIKASCERYGLFNNSGKLSAREVLQCVGTEIFRNMFDKDVWVNTTFRRIKDDGRKFAFIADVRFKSEVKSIVENGGYIIHLTRKINKEDKHASEVDLDDFDFSSLGKKCLVIDNDGKTIRYKNKIAKEYFNKTFARIL